MKLYNTSLIFSYNSLFNVLELTLEVDSCLFYLLK